MVLDAFVWQFVCEGGGGAGHRGGLGRGEAPHAQYSSANAVAIETRVDLALSVYVRRREVWLMSELAREIPTTRDLAASNVTLVVHESNSPWPDAVGSPGLWIIAQQPEESLERLSERVQKRLRYVSSAPEAILLAWLACGDASDCFARAARERIVVAVAETMVRSGGGRIVIQADPGAAPAFELANLICEKFADPALSVTLHFGPCAGEPSGAA